MGESLNWEILTFNDCRAKYGFAELNEVFVFFEQLAGFCRKDSIDIELLPLELGRSGSSWEKIMPTLEVVRKSSMNQKS